MTWRSLAQRARPVLAVLAVAVAGGCATPVGVTSLGRNYAYEQIDRCALNSRAYSSYTANVLHRYDLERVYAKSPTRCLAQLHAQALSDSRRDTLFALAELSFLQGKRGRSDKVDGHRLTSRNYYAASVVYAYLFLTGLSENRDEIAFDRRFRIASDLYNRGLGYIVTLRDAPGSGQEHVLWLPVGKISIQNGYSDFPKPLSEYDRVVSADRYQIHGLSVRNRSAGMGSPILVGTQQKQTRGAVPKTSAATLFIRVEGGLADFDKGTLSCTLEVYAADLSRTVQVNGRTIPLEADITAPIAYTLNNPLFWQIEKRLFRFGQSAFEPGIYPSGPYRPGKVPVLWVHGTMSSPVWWAEMWNTLMGDPVLRENCQHWFYLYDSGKPIMQSVVHLRKSIEELVRQLDPEGKDPALRQMVVIGHSQGGLLTKATAVNTGDVLVRALTGKTFAELKLAPEDEKLMRSYTLLTPLPEVKRVVFIATPHRGSFLASGLARRAARWFIHLPQSVLQTSAEVMRLIPKEEGEVRLASTSLDSMSPDNPALLALADVPVAPPVKAHSIIAIKGDEAPPDGDDGVVKYASAHVAGVESELVVRSGHSCQGRPKTIEEVRRILLEHLASFRPPDKADSCDLKHEQQKGKAP